MQSYEKKWVASYIHTFFKKKLTYINTKQFAIKPFTSRWNGIFFTSNLLTHFEMHLTAIPNSSRRINEFIKEFSKKFFIFSKNLFMFWTFIFNTYPVSGVGLTNLYPTKTLKHQIAPKHLHHNLYLSRWLFQLFCLCLQKY